MYLMDILGEVSLVGFKNSPPESEHLSEIRIQGQLLCN